MTFKNKKNLVCETEVRIVVILNWKGDEGGLLSSCKCSNVWMATLVYKHAKIYLDLPLRFYTLLCAINTLIKKKKKEKGGMTEV